MARRLIRWCATALSVAASAQVAAQAVAIDPTRPPASVGESASETQAPAAPILQTVIIPHSGKPIAVIGGKQVRQGEMYGDSRLVRVSEREVVLVGPNGTERLSLTPEVKKSSGGEVKPTGRMAAGAARSKGKE